MLISNGRTASQPYTSEKGVFPVAVCIVVQLSHRMDGSNSCHFPFMALRCFFSESMTVLLLDSASSLASGYLGIDVNNVMLHSSPKRLVLSLMNFDPLTRVISNGTPNLQILLVCIKKIYLSRTYWNYVAYIHLEK